MMFCSEAGLRRDGSADCVNPRTAQALPGRNPPEPRLRPLSCLASSPRQTSGRAVPGHRRRTACRFASCCYSSSSSACNRAPRAIPHSRLGSTRPIGCARSSVPISDVPVASAARSCGHQCITGRRSCAGGGTDIAAEGESPIRDLVVPPFPPAMTRAEKASQSRCVNATVSDWGGKGEFSLPAFCRHRGRARPH